MHPEPERIVVGMAEGKLAAVAVAAAMELSELFDAQLDVVHAVDIEPPTRGNASTKHWAEVADDALSRARAACEGELELTVEHPRFAERPISDYLSIVVGRPAQVLLSRARDQEAGLIVLGPHRHRHLFDFGGTARGVLAGSPCPVWVQPRETGPVDRVLAPVDLSEGSDTVLATARLCAARFDAAVEVLFAFAPPAFAYDEVAQQAVGPAYVVEDLERGAREDLVRLVEDFPWNGVHATARFEEGDPAQVILEREGEHDLVVMGTHGRTGFARAILGSQAYRVIKGAVGPVLAVPQPAHLYDAP
jgi:nucleotide-binding universal stress UspA family protein